MADVIPITFVPQSHLELHAQCSGRHYLDQYICANIRKKSVPKEPLERAPGWELKNMTSRGGPLSCQPHNLDKLLHLHQSESFSVRWRGWSLLCLPWDSKRIKWFIYMNKVFDFSEMLLLRWCNSGNEVAIHPKDPWSHSPQWELDVHSAESRQQRDPGETCWIPKWCS